MSAAVQLPPLPQSDAPVRDAQSVASGPGEAGVSGEFAELMDLFQVPSNIGVVPAAVANPNERANPESGASSISGASAQLPDLLETHRLAAEVPVPRGLPAPTELLAALPRAGVSDSGDERPAAAIASPPGRPEIAAAALPVSTSTDEIVRDVRAAAVPLRPEVQQIATGAVPRERGAGPIAEVPESQKERVNSRLPRAASVAPDRVDPENPPAPPTRGASLAGEDGLDARTPERQAGDASTPRPLERKPAEFFTPPRESAPPVQNSDSVAPNAIVHATRGGVEATPRQPEVPAEAAIGQRISWLASRGGGSARVVLHPAELGEVEITVHVRGSRVEVSIQTETAATRTALIEARDGLNESFAARDLRIESLEVRVAEARPSSGDGSSLGTPGRDAASDHSNANSGQQRGGDRDATPTRHGTPQTNRFQGSTEDGPDPQIGRLDLHV